MKIKRFNYNRKKSTVEIEYEGIPIVPTDKAHVSFEAKDRPVSELVMLLDQLRPHVETICSMPKDYCKDAEVRSISFSYKNNILGAVITVLVDLDSTNSPLLINTPYLPAEHIDDDSDAPLLPEACVELLESILEGIEEYIKGKRAPKDQTELEFPKEPVTENPEDDDTKD